MRGETFIINPKHVIRKTKTDEAICLDKECPKCGKPLIFRWRWAPIYAYDPNSARCSNPQCKYGN